MKKDLCRTCPSRESCKEICAALKSYLKRFTRYQCEYPIDSLMIQRLLSTESETLADYQPDHEWLYRELLPWLQFLTPDLRTTFVMHYYDGMKMVKIAGVLGITRWTVSDRLKKAVAILKAAIHSESGGS
jgi:RNA polymerase sigma factor (sigma-70 family)